MTSHRGWIVAASALAVGLSGCGGGGGGTAASGSAASGSAPSGGSSTSSSPAATSAASTPAPDPATACAKVTLITVPGAAPADYQVPGGTVLHGAVVGSGTDAAVMLHQTSGGYCGFWPYLAAVGKPAFKAYLVDLCGYGTTGTCAAPPDLSAQVKAVVDQARKDGATRVTLVGASMGGSVAVGVAGDVGADAVVDLSGPQEWQGVPGAAEAAPRLTMPLLAAASTEDASDLPAIEAMVKAAPAKQKAFVSLPEGHGWSLLTTGAGDKPTLTPLGQQVTGWIAGRQG